MNIIINKNIIIIKNVNAVYMKKKKKNQTLIIRFNKINIYEMPLARTQNNLPHRKD